MSARPGGEADKFGSLYEGAWTIHHLLLVLSGGANAITVENVGEIAQGAEFTLLRNGATEVHQVKVKYRNANGWTPTILQAENVLDNARHHVTLGRQFHFISTIPAPKLVALTDRSRRSASLQSFVTDWMTEGLRPDWDYLVANAGSSDQSTWQLLRGMWMHCVGETDIRHMNDALAGLLRLFHALPTPVAAVRYVLPPGAIHGDPFLGNLIPGPEGPVLCDFDSTSIGPREWDLTPIAVGKLRFNYPHDDHSLVAAGYGFDVTTWEGFPVLRRIRELKLVTSVVPILRSNPSIRNQWRHRLETFKCGDAGAKWETYR